MNTSRYWVALAAALLVAGCSGEDSTAPPIETADAVDDSASETTPLEGEPTESGAIAKDQPVVAISETPDVPPLPAAEGDAQDEMPGLAVGQKALEFELNDQNGESRTLAGILESGNSALVFYRSADW